MRLAYLVHDIADAAVKRRVALFEAAGLQVKVAGFHRDTAVASVVGHAPVVPLGRTRDGALVQRALAVLRHVVVPARISRMLAEADVIVARQLETLVLAQRARRPGQRLVYECLDIHRLLLGQGRASQVLHAVERWAMRDLDLIVVSAPAFRDRYFREQLGYRGAVQLVENLVPCLDDAPIRVVEPPPPRPWIIGWFGMLRDRRGFEMLKAIALAGRGTIEVVIAGRASPDVFSDFAAEVTAVSGMSYLGPYTAADLPGLFGRIHIIWAIDYFEEGLNSVWLLPNRLYEGVAHGAVPVALRGVATGAWLEGRGVGLLLDAPVAELPALLNAMTPAAYRGLRNAIAAVPAEAVTMNRQQAREIAGAITGAA